MVNTFIFIYLVYIFRNVKLKKNFAKRKRNVTWTNFNDNLRNLFLYCLCTHTKRRHTSFDQYFKNNLPYYSVPKKE